MATGYYTHTDCLKHEMGEGHPESPERLSAIEDRLIASGLANFLEHRQASPATDSQLQMAHSPAYIARLQSEQEILRQERAAGGPAYRYVDSETMLNEFTCLAARRAAGLAIESTRAVASGELTNAFCAIRPPGHHAQKSHAHGFCFFNNVALAALYALNHLGLERVAIVDFDVHHGDGTQSILAPDPRVLLAGFFQYPFFPFADTPFTAGNTLNIPVERYTKGSAIREMITSRWLPALDEFAPQMIFISAGFDAHREDDMGQLGLVENDYAWITRQIMQIAKRHASGRIVSCLEGGYDLSALGRSVEVHIRALAGLD